jgi:phosphatidylethanolamine/phosphatidyl-N-methylethanolamine N-methyltransferase
MPYPALQLLERKFERQRRIFEFKRDAFEKRIEQHMQRLEARKDEFERKIEHQLEERKQRIEQSLESQKKKIETRLRSFERKNGIRIDDEVRFIRTWFENPLATGAVTPSSRALARTMAAYVDPETCGSVVELGPGTGAVTQALVDRGVDPGRLVLVESDAAFCRMLRARYPSAKIVQGDAYGLRRILGNLLNEPAAAVVSGLPLFTKPLRTRLRLLFEAFGIMGPAAPFVQFTYNAVAPIPRRLALVRVEASERVWKNIPPARVWVYRRD